jgi:tetratricopeptide (TPR) repeat protein
MRPSLCPLAALALVLAGCSSDPEPVPEPAPVEAAPVTTTAAADPVTDEATDHSRRGMALLNEQRFDEAVQSFSRAIQLTPDDAYPYAGRALAHNQLGKSEEAVTDVSKAIELTERTTDQGFVLDLYALRGWVLTDLGRWKEGEADLTRCIDNGKDELELRLSRGICLLELGQPDRALADAEAVITHAPEGDDTRSRGLRLRGLVHEHGGAVDKAIADFEAAAAAGNADAEEDLERVRAAAPR